MDETKREMTKRHVQEGAYRIAQQKMRIESLIAEGHEAMVPVGRDLLDKLEGLQKVFEQRLARFQAEASPSPEFS